MSWTLCTSGSAILKAGIHVDTSIHSGANFDALSDEAEGSIEQDTNTSWVASYTGLSTSIKNALGDICSARIAKKLIAYNPTGYLAREADMLVNINDDIETKGLDALRGKPDKLKSPV